jgi:hypothetical protein
MSASMVASDFLIVTQACRAGFFFLQVHATPVEFFFPKM